jgi:hypothetical protein
MADGFGEFSYLAPLITTDGVLPDGVLPPPLFVHAPLQSRDSIRLLQIHAGDWEANVTLTIAQTCLKAAPPYEAISYTWGDGNDLQRIICGSDDQGILVTKNCESVLRRLRRSNEDRLVWVDAICIDQNSIEERNAQVTMMGQIYQEASRVIIDIGEESSNSDHALDAIMHCSEEALYGFEPGLHIRDTVNELYRRPWFKRVWVLQEVFRSKEALVLCGTRLIPWETFRPFRIWVDSRPAWESEHWHVELPAIVPHALTVGYHKSRTYTAREDLLPLLCKGRTCASTDPRDKVFALLPMLEEALPKNLSADYAKETVQVFTEVATWLLSVVGLSFLPCVKEGSKLTALPSWVPDWSLHVREPWIIGLGGIYYPLSAGGNTNAVAEVLLSTYHTPQLKVRGIAVDTIRKSSKDLPIRSDSETLANFVSDCRSYRTQDPRGSVRLPRARHWAPRTSEKRLHPPKWAAYEYGLPLEKPLEESDNDLADKMTYFCSARQLVLTKRGYFGVAPSEAEPGDIVCCLLGGGVPYILRKAEDYSKGTQSCFRLIGESYIYGLMEGEALEGIDLSKIEQMDAPAPLEDFHIC